MENITPESKKMMPSEIYKVELQSRGALGLQLLFRTDNDAIVAIKRLYNEMNMSGPVDAGDPLMVAFEITALKKGDVNIVFYETQPWNKAFKEIIKKEISIEVGE
jgi:hypothetical protein